MTCAYAEGVDDINTGRRTSIGPYVRRKDKRRVRDLLYRGVAGQRNNAALVVLELLGGVGTRVQHASECIDAGRLGGARADHVDANLAVPQLTFPGAGD